MAPTYHPGCGGFLRQTNDRARAKCDGCAAHFKDTGKRAWTGFPIWEQEPPVADGSVESGCTCLGFHGNHYANSCPLTAKQEAK